MSLEKLVDGVCSTYRTTYSCKLTVDKGAYVTVNSDRSKLGSNEYDNEKPQCTTIAGADNVSKCANTNCTVVTFGATGRTATGSYYMPHNVSALTQSVDTTYKTETMDNKYIVWPSFG